LHNSVQVRVVSAKSWLSDHAAAKALKQSPKRNQAYSWLTGGNNTSDTDFLGGDVAGRVVEKSTNSDVNATVFAQRRIHLNNQWVAYR
jgi:hypothetical protein